MLPWRQEGILPPSSLDQFEKEVAICRASTHSDTDQNLAAIAIGRITILPSRVPKNTS
jgi:hypothetical protein